MPRCPLDLGFPHRGATELESGTGFSRLKGSTSSAEASPELYLSPPTAGHQGLDMQAVLRGLNSRDMLPGMNFTFHPGNYSSLALIKHLAPFWTILEKLEGKGIQANISINYLAIILNSHLITMLLC